VTNMRRFESITGFFSKVGVAAALLIFVAIVLLSRLGGAPARPTLLVLDGACAALIAAASLTFVRLRRRERELRDAEVGIENQTIVLELQAIRLGDKEREIRVLNQELEARVEQRTHALAQANQALDAASKAKSEFLANMSHELRTPMTAVLGYAELLLDHDLTAEARIDHVFTIRRNGEHLLAVINDILDLSKIEAGRMTVERIPCSPSQLVSDVVSLLHVRAASKGITVQVRYQTPIPELIRTDPTRLRQLLLNLLGNAIKFTERGSVQLLVRCDAAREQIAFEVADTGIGLSAEHLERLFQPFTQADTSTTRVFGGTGLGLAICHRLAGMLGGDIQVTSVLGRGSSFVLTLGTGPLGDVRMIEGPSAPAPATKRAPPPPVRLHGSVLLAEDSRANQVLLATFLRKAGAEVTIAENGRIAVDEALARQSAGHGFDVILMDMQMPVLDGYSATTTLRQAGYRRPVVALTAHAMGGDQEKCLSAGCDDYLTKPVERGALIAKVASWIERSRSGAEAPALAAPLEAAVPCS
jgi:signal transduction histidine kinase/FixJ family two-component response regulator